MEDMEGGSESNSEDDWKESEACGLEDMVQLLATPCHSPATPCHSLPPPATPVFDMIACCFLGRPGARGGPSRTDLLSAGESRLQAVVEGGERGNLPAPHHAPRGMGVSISKYTVVSLGIPLGYVQCLLNLCLLFY